MARPYVDLSPILLWFLVILVKTCSVHSESDSASTVKFLPGFQGPLPFHFETGYVGVGDRSEDSQFFYYFVKSDRNPEKDPLVLWLTGGPGCSAWSGLVYEIGPLRYKFQKYNGSTPTLVLNQYSWTKVSNIIFVDAPVGTGYSYAKTPLASHLSDFKSAKELFQFFNKWLNNHPEYISNPVYIAGDSYSGIIVPVLTQLISNGIKEGIIPPINLEGYVLGNPRTEYHLNNNYKISFAYGMTLISYELYQSLEKSCRGEYTIIDPNNTECLKFVQAYKKCISGINLGSILEPKCRPNPKPRERRSLNQNSEMLIDFDSELAQHHCREHDYSQLCYFWANDPRVREALRIRKGSTGEWHRCNDDLQSQYNREIRSNFQYHVNLSANGYRSLIYSGDHDLIISNLGTQAWIKSLNYSIVDDWRPWIVQGQVAGFTRGYANQMTFATVKGGSHTAPDHNPKECFAMFKRWINYESL